MPADSVALREAIIGTARAMNAAGINRGTSGNVSARVAGGFLVTPSGLPYAETAADDIVFVDAPGAARGRRAPSSEWRFHRDIYEARADASAIVHVHSPFATTLAWAAAASASPTSAPTSSTASWGTLANVASLANYSFG